MLPIFSDLMSSSFNFKFFYFVFTIRLLILPYRGDCFSCIYFVCNLMCTCIYVLLYLPVNTISYKVQI